jgi:hypothetical protein
MTTQKVFKKYFLLTILSGVVALAPQHSKAGDVQTMVEGDMGASSSDDTYLKDLVDNLKTIESAPEYKAALADLKSSTVDCTSLKEWAYSKPDLSANLVVKKIVPEPTIGSPQGPAYTVTLSFPDVTKDSFHSPIEIFSNPSLLTETSLIKLYKKTIERVSDAAHMNRLYCSRLASEKKEESKQVSSSN